MTLNDYLKSPKAVEDAKRLLDRYRGDEWPMGCDSSSDCALWSAKKSDAWTMVEVSQIQTPRLRCYYRPDGTGFVVSDCGETVSEVMRRKGCVWSMARDRVVEDVGSDWLAMSSGDISTMVPATDLPAAIVSVLSAIAQVREVQS